jgi:hypothetical protein
MNKLVKRMLESPEARKRRIARKRVDPAAAAAIKRLYSEDLDLSPADLIYRAVMSANASRAGKARANKLSAARRSEIARKAARARHGSK